MGHPITVRNKWRQRAAQIVSTHGLLCDTRDPGPIRDAIAAELQRAYNEGKADGIAAERDAEAILREL